MIARILLSTALLSSCLAAPPPAERPTSAPQPDVRADELAQSVHQEVRRVREARDLRAYRWRIDLARTARDHSDDMIRRGFFGHVAPTGETPNDRAARNGIACRTERGGQTFVGVAENLFQSWLYSGYTTWQTPDSTWNVYDWRSRDELARETVQGWLDSPPHREVLLDAHSRDHGIGVAIGDDGEVYVGQLVC